MAIDTLKLIEAAESGFYPGHLVAAHKGEESYPLARAIVAEIEGALDDDADAQENVQNVVNSLSHLSDELRRITRAIENYTPDEVCPKCSGVVPEDGGKSWCSDCRTCLECCQHAEEEI